MVMLLGAAEPSPVIALQPMGKVDPEIVECVSKRLEGAFNCKVAKQPPISLPASAFYPPRKRYRGERILDFLEATASAGRTKILAITSEDISVTKGSIQDWGVFGVAYVSRPPAVISTFRLGRGNPPWSLLSRRVREVAVHELGHTFGLQHCPSTGCIMEDARGALKTVDESSGRFCPACAKQLGSWLKPQN